MNPDVPSVKARPGDDHAPRPYYEDEVARLAANVIELRFALSGLLSYVEADHRCTITQHGHDCYELWKVEQEFSRSVLADTAPRGDE